MTNVIDLSGAWSTIERVANERNDQKRAFKSTRQYNKNPHLPGVAGEWAYGLFAGLEPNLELLIQGHPEPDFPGVEVKTSTYYADPWLRMFTEERLRAPAYVLCALDQPNRKVRVVGWASRRDIILAPLERLGVRGIRRVLRHDELHEMRQLETVR